MTTYTVTSADLKVLEGKTVLITGGASGIGRAAVDIALEQGANVVIGDWSEKLEYELVDQHKDRVLFRKCDISNWDNVLHLFQDATVRFGIIHVVLSNADVNAHEDLLDETFDADGKLKAPSLKSIDINLVGQLYVVRCAMHYFAKWPETACQLVLTSSAGAFFPAPPLYMYCAAKSGVLGLIRGLRSEVVKKNVTINTVAPWLTVTPMLLSDWLDNWPLPKNTPEGAALALFLPTVQAVNGKSFFVAGDKIIELEDTLNATEPMWMGEQLCDDVRKGQEILLGLK
ncbi:hypothetical protein SBRCBS47491_009708 [Sporothrix bragantina]|uniref:Uncharacterized protein n=1 Tax=Sporothrix bragantina TaxID=671064 RepID=A0ABP0CWX9_9PEZI